MLLNPVLYWLNYAIESPERLNMFNSAYKALKDIASALPEEVEIDIPELMFPVLERTCSFLKHNSPTLPMLKFLKTVLWDYSPSKPEH